MGGCLAQAAKVTRDGKHTTDTKDRMGGALEDGDIFFTARDFSVRDLKFYNDSGKRELEVRKSNTKVQRVYLRLR